VNGLGQIMISLVSISSTFYEQLLSPKIPKVQKDTDDLTEFFTFFRSSGVKVVSKHVGEMTPDRVILTGNLKVVLFGTHLIDHVIYVRVKRDGN